MAVRSAQSQAALTMLPLRTRRACVLIVALCTVFVWTNGAAQGEAAGRARKVSEIPNPYTDPASCGRPDGVAHSWVCDPDQILSRDEQDTVDGVAGMIAQGLVPYKKLTCGNQLVGVQVAVAIIAKMDFGTGSASASKLPEYLLARHAEAFAKQLHDAWGVGDAQCNFGALVFISVVDRRVHISTGKGVLQYLPDKAVDAIIAEARPYLRHEDYGRAAEDIVHNIGRIVSGKELRSSGVAGWLESLKEWLIPGAFVALFGGMTYFSNRQTQRRTQEYSRVVTQLTRIEEDRARARANEYQQRSCPICLDDFPQDTSAERVPDERSSDTDGGTRNEGITFPKSDATMPLSPNIHADESAGAGGSTSAVVTERVVRRKRTGSHSASSDAKDDDSRSSSDAAGRVTPAVAPAPAEGTAGMAEGSNRPNAPSDVVLMRCGHKYHRSCITSWAQRGSNLDCPVCRTPLGGPDDSSRPDDNDDALPPGVDDADYPGGGLGGTGSASSFGNGCVNPMMRANQQRAWDREMRFRLFRLHHRYPQFISPSMYHRWNRGWGAPNTTFVQDASFRALNPQLRAQARGMGRSGTSVRFGGGSSRGGGGRGGGW
ncbi:hypothetical protein FVE85_1083 [Porphyridium purpureum]|uniref:RING-type domain-containing protein n=1 Tax=Porphyridium purpureum TaxID=35688 RepID=A0A5J4Z379_PORPP|nr:hypothetical protein FVE85_1083 [Porphyridium purpureum]|eukprot:POR4730..scf208_2